MGRFERILNFLTSTDFFLGLLWAGLAAISITLLVLMRTRWGQSQPLRKCLVLSLLAHLLLIGYATTVTICADGPRRSSEPSMRISLSDSDETPSPEAMDSPTPDAKPWEQFVASDVVEPKTAEIERAPLDPSVDLRRETPADVDQPRDETNIADLSSSPVDESPIDTSEWEPAPHHPMVARQAEPLDAPEAERREASPGPTPSAATAGRITATEETPQREAGLPSVRVDAPLPAPRVAQEPNTAAEAELLRDMVDLVPSPPRGDPAEATAEPSAGDESASTASETASASSSQDRPADAREMPEVEPGSTQMALNRPETSLQDVPAIYRARMAPDRSRRAEEQGATPESELAVREGLKWLAANQEPDGRWNARRHGAGREMYVNGEDRHGAGIDADTGMTALSLLAFLAAGNTHDRPGPYQDTVRKGLDYLLRVQKSDGNLSGDASGCAAMYCHAMAAFALSEAHAMTGDARLERHVGRAVDYIIDAQDRRGGGWRYEPGDPGDTSLLGWQLMALKSAELGGIGIPDATRNGALRFLASVSSGPTGGLAAYRPGQRVTPPMTAEALVCRQLLGMPPESPTATEAADYLMGELPGERQVNLYYWYYATLGLYQLQGEHWVRWNRALQNDLVARQRMSGEMAGSWDPVCVWGGYGGRVYSTALATLCLQVYYRYVPMYLETAESDGRSTSR